LFLFKLSFVDYSFVGAGLILASSFRRRDRQVDAWVAVALIAASAFSLPAVTFLTAPAHATYDNFLYLADRWLRFDTVRLARLVYGTRLLWVLIEVIYVSLPLAVAIAWAAERSRLLVKSLLVAAILAPASYWLLPALGPIHVFPGYPWTLPRPPPTLFWVYENLPRNAFPSLHFAWALLIYMHANRKALKVFSLAFLFGTALATMGSGEHYAVDLIASVPFCLLVQMLANTDLQRMWQKEIIAPRRAVQGRTISAAREENKST
jgi:PAP2 superfamily